VALNGRRPRLAPECTGGRRIVAALTRRWLLPALLGTLAAATATAAAATEPFALAGHDTVVDLYAPPARPRAIAVVAHGFTRSRAQHAGLGARLAEAGFLVAVPDLPHWTRHEVNAQAIAELVGQLAARPDAQALPVVLIGTSAGGLAALLAAAQVPRLALWVGLDPVDAFGQAKEAAQQLRAPALVLRAPAGACNVGGSARRIAGSLAGRPAARRIDDASHCDFEDTTDSGCEAICGAADPARQALIVEATVRAAVAAVADGEGSAPDASWR
jgi:pimeloyl-ACP methyl ester carboxylesterase